MGIFSQGTSTTLLLLAPLLGGMVLQMYFFCSERFFLLPSSLSLPCDALNAAVQAWHVVPGPQILNALGSQIPMGCSIHAEFCTWKMWKTIENQTQ